MTAPTPRPVGRPRTPAPAVALSDALAGDRVAVLTALRAYTAAVLDGGVSPREVAPLIRRLSEIDAELRASTPDAESDAERIRRERAERRAPAHLRPRTGEADADA